MSRQEGLEHLESMVDSPLAEEIRTLPDAALVEVVAYVDELLIRERAGLDRLFESISPTMKYIPNFLLHALTKKFIDPPIAAKITEKLDLKQAVGVATGLSAEYVAEAALYLEPQLAADLLNAFSKRFAKEVIAELLKSHPLKLLDVVHYLNERQLVLIPAANLQDRVGDCGKSEHRLAALHRVISA